MKNLWPLPEPIAKRTVITSSVLALVSGLSVIRGVLSLDPLVMETTKPWFIWPMIVSALLSLIVFLSRMLQIRSTVREHGAGRVTSAQKRAAMVANLPLYIPHLFLLMSGVWFQTTGRNRLELMSKQASSEYKQRFLARKAAREQGRKSPPLDNGGR